MVADLRFDPEEILQVLEEHDVRYVVVGGFALAAHGVVRATADVDLVVERSWDNAERLARALLALEAVDLVGSQNPISQDALVRPADRRMRTRAGDIHLLHEVAGVPRYADLLPSETLELAGLRVPVATLPALRAMKRKAGRAKDEVDLAELDALHGTEPD